MNYNYNVLPLIGYTTWRAIWESAKMVHIPGNKHFAIDIAHSGEVHIYIFEIDFIKARCWDEVQSNLFTEHQLTSIYDSVSCYPGIWDIKAIQNKLKALCSK